MSYKQVYDTRAHASAGFIAMGIKPGAHLGLYSINCTEWCLLESAMTRIGCVSVPLYDTLGPDAVRFISNHAELAAVCVSAACLPTMLDCLGDCPSVKLLVVYGLGGATPPRAPRRRGRDARSSRSSSSSTQESAAPPRPYLQTNTRWRPSATRPERLGTRRG